MEEQLSEVLDNLLGLLLLEGSYEIEENDEAMSVLIETPDAGRLIGARGESLEALQLLTNQILSYRARHPSLKLEFKRVILDVAGWRKQKEAELITLAQELGRKVKETGEALELEPMSPWQRRLIHMTIQGTEGLMSESVGEGRDRHVVIKLKTQNSNVKTSKT